MGVLAIAALAIDMGHLLQIRSHLQGVADASALAAAQELPNVANAKTVAQTYANQNASHSGTVVHPGEVVTGNWDGLGAFTPGGAPLNAVRVVARRTKVSGNPVGLFFARIFGSNVASVSAWATATSGGAGGGVVPDNQFIIDSEMIDKDVPSIEALADAAGVDGEQLINDNDGDWFVDIPHVHPVTGGDVILEVPTGQTGDEGIFDIDNDAFKFLDPGPATPNDGYCSSPCTYADFLNYNEDSNSWRYGLIDKPMLDPLLGVDVVSHNHRYPYTLKDQLGDENDDLRTPCFLSPLYKGDVNRLNPVNGVPAVNALGLRRGLLAFSIEAIGVDPDGDSHNGGGSVLPNIFIKVCDPTPFDPDEDAVVQLPYAPNLPLRLVQ